MAYVQYWRCSFAGGLSVWSLYVLSVLTLVSSGFPTQSKDK